MWDIAWGTEIRITERPTLIPINTLEELRLPAGSLAQIALASGGPFVFPNRQYSIA